MRRSRSPLPSDLDKLLRTGITAPRRCMPLVSVEEIEVLRERYEVEVDGWSALSRTQRLDVIATKLLHDDFQTNRPPRGQSGGTKLERLIHGTAVRRARCGILSAWQYGERARHEVLFPHLDFFPRENERQPWRWHDGGWYGDAPRMVQEVLPREYDGVQRSAPPEKVGVMWSLPIGTRGKHAREREVAG